MRQDQVFSGIVMGGAAALLATQPSFAAATQVTAVRLNESGSELQLILETKGGDELPQVYTVNRGKDLVADLANTQLNLQEGDSFRQENPLPGITALVVSQSDANSVRVTVTGAQNSPIGQIIQTERQGITLGISPASKSQAATPMAVSSSADTSVPSTAPNISALKAPTTSLPPKQNTPSTVAQTPQSVAPEQEPSVQTLAQTPQSVELEQRPSVPTLVQAPQPVAQGQTPTAPDPTIPTVVQPPTVPAPAPDVLVPNPRITIDGNPAPAAGAVQPIAPAPPFLPRAIRATTWRYCYLQYQCLI